MLPADQGSAGGSAERAGGGGTGVPPSRGGHKAPFPPRRWGGRTDRDLMCGLVGRRFRSNSVTFYKEC